MRKVPDFSGIFLYICTNSNSSIVTNIPKLSHILFFECVAFSLCTNSVKMSVIKKCENWCSLSKSYTTFYYHDIRSTYYNGRGVLILAHRQELRYATANAVASRFPKKAFMANYGVVCDRFIATESQAMRHQPLNHNALDILQIKHKSIDF